MSLDSYMGEKEAQTRELKPLPMIEGSVEWDGKDFRGDRCIPAAVEFVKKHKVVYTWLRSHPKGYIHSAYIALKGFCKFANIGPEKFLTMDKKSARDLVWEYIDSFRMTKSVSAQVSRSCISSFYLFVHEERLEWIRGKHDIVCEPTHDREFMNKDVCWRLINKTRSLHDETLLTCAYESGLRRNALYHLTYGHFKNFQWFNGGQIAIFKVQSQAHRDYTHDNKLRGKGINWYYALLHKEATERLKEYVDKYHQDSQSNTPFWQIVDPNAFLRIVKASCKRANLDSRKITFHAFRRGFRNVIRKTETITDHDFKEAIMGHKLRGSQENYFDKDPKEFAEQYSKCDFSPSAEVIAEKEKEIQELKDQLGAIEKVSIDEWFSQYERDMNT